MSEVPLYRRSFGILVLVTAARAPVKDWAQVL